MLSLRSFDARQVMFPPRGRILTLFHVQLALQARIARRSSTHFHLAVTCRGLPLPCCGGPVLKRMWSDRKGHDPEFSSARIHSLERSQRPDCKLCSVPGFCSYASTYAYSTSSPLR